MKIEGWLTKKEGGWLKKIAKDCHEPILEIGSYHGLSTSYIAHGVIEGYFAPVYAVDNHQHMGHNSYPIFLKNMLELEILHFIKPIKMASHEFRQLWNDKTKLDFLFIDGDHSYDGCHQDWVDWSPLVREGGIIALHDAQGEMSGDEVKYGHNAFGGVAQVADEHIKGKVEEWGVVDRICWMRV